MGCEQRDILNDFLSVDSGQPLSGWFSLKSILPKRGSAFYINGVISGFSHGREPLQLLLFWSFAHGSISYKEWRCMILNPKLLVVDDERGIVDMIQSYFQTQYDILTAYSGQEALKKVACKPDLILLDINMPGMDGLTVCQQIREHIACPILFLTARIESSDKIIGFQAGADDYIVKPFDLDELGARIAAHLRREQRRQNNSAVRFFGELILDYSARTVTINNQNIPLSKREFEIVELLSLNAGQVFDRERIYERVWGLDGDGNSDTIMEHIRKIRAKFAAHTLHNYIETVWGCGYRWNA
ncbi:response regulator transcription factor [Faecalibacterium prausnitzii]